MVVTYRGGERITETGLVKAGKQPGTFSPADCLNRKNKPIVLELGLVEGRPGTEGEK